jgi:hypothetical protein
MTAPLSGVPVSLATGANKGIGVEQEEGNLDVLAVRAASTTAAPSRAKSAAAAAQTVLGFGAATRAD